MKRMSDGTPPRILVVDDDVDGLEVLKTRLVHAGYDVEIAESAEKALAKVSAFDPGLIVTDVRMPGMSGLELLERVRGSMEGVEVVVMTAHDDMQTAVSAMKAGAFDFLVKPVDPKAVQGLADRCFRERALAIEDQPDAEVDAVPRGRIVGRDPQMVDIYKTIGVLAGNRATPGLSRPSTSPVSATTSRRSPPPTTAGRGSTSTIRPAPRYRAR
jgi:DNA-binding NtrC family response regulator